MISGCPHAFSVCRALGAGKPIATAFVTVNVDAEEGSGGGGGGDKAFMDLAALLTRTCTRVSLSVYSSGRGAALAAVARTAAVAGGLSSSLVALHVDHRIPPDQEGATASMGFARLAAHAFPLLTWVTLYNATPVDIAELAGLQVGAAGGRGGR